MTPATLRTPTVYDASPRRVPVAPVHRIGAGGAREDRLFFAQVREDPLLEIEALRPALGGRIVTIGSGGCTALSLLASGTGDVVAVDLNRSQNHLTELKMVALAALERPTARVFLGASAGSARKRLDLYAFVRPVLSRDAREYWDARLADVGAGILGAGVSEKFIRVVLNALRIIRRGPARLRRLLDCDTLYEQREFYRDEWDSFAWRTLIRLMLSRRRLTGVYDRGFFDQVEQHPFGEHFLRQIEHGLTELPVATNYFLHHMATGTYPAGRDDALPPYLTNPGAAAVAERRGQLTLVDGSLGDYLATQPADSISGFALSNICEWLDEPATDALFREVVRTARPGAVVCIRNFLGWTEVPLDWRETVIEDRARGDAMIARDRSLIQRRFVPCVIRKEAP